MLRAFGFFGSQQNREFVIGVFAASVVPAIVVVSSGTKCNGEVLEALLVMCCKILSYENRSDRQARLWFISRVRGQHSTRRFNFETFALLAFVLGISRPPRL